MNITREDLPERQVALTIQLDPAEIEPALQKVYKQHVNRVNIPGFRPGKAPRAFFERYVGREVMVEQAVETLLTTSLPEALKDQGIEGSDISDVHVESTNPVVLRVIVEQPAQIELGDYSDIRVARDAVEIPPERVDEVITGLLRREGTWATPAEPRPAQMNDRVVVDMETYTIDGPVKNMTGEKLSMELLPTAAPTWPAEIDPSIVGMLPEEEKDFAITFPPEYPDEDLRNKDATVHVKLHSLEEMTMPEMDDAFAKRVAGVETVDELHQRIADNLHREADEKAEGAQVDEVVKQIIERSTVEVPRGLIDREVDHQFEHLQESLRERHIDPRRYFTLTGTSEADWRTAQREPARTRLQRNLVLGEFARREGVDVSAADVDRVIEERMQSFVGTEGEERIREVFSSPEQRERMENELFERRMIERLVALAEGREPAPAEAAETPAAEEGTETATADEETASTSIMVDAGADPAADPESDAPADEAVASDMGMPSNEAPAEAPAAEDTGVAVSPMAAADGDGQPTISGAIPATEQEPGPLEVAGGAAEVLGAGDTSE